MKTLPTGNWKLVNMSHNAISSISRCRFWNNSVEIIDISYNVIENIDRYVFSRNCQLKQIDISWNNIRFVYPETFLFTQKLERLCLSHNKLLTLESSLMFSGNSLKILDISYCNISSIDKTTIKYGVSNLQELYLQYNAITYISHDSFISLTNVKVLNIAYNKLHSVHMDIFVHLKGLTDLMLGNNPSPCNCHLRDIYFWCFKHRIKLENMTCEKFGKTRKIDWSEFSDIMKCSYNYEAQNTGVTEVRDRNKESDSQDSGGLSAVAIVVIALVVVVMVIIICACLLSRSHDCLGAIGCALICTECLD
jgi:Leucine-rich repeat (LRR) protein